MSNDCHEPYKVYYVGERTGVDFWCLRETTNKEEAEKYFREFKLENPKINWELIEATTTFKKL